MLEIVAAKLAKGTFIYGFGGMLQRLMSLLLLPFFTQVLTPADYGVVTLISVLGLAMSGILTLGTGNSMSVLFFREKNISKRATIVWSNVTLMLVNGLWWYVVIYFTSPTLSKLIFQTEGYADLIRLSFLGSVFVAIAQPWLLYLRMIEKAKNFVVFTLISSLMTISLSIFLVLVLRIGVTGVILASTLSQGIILLIYWIFIGRSMKFEIDINLFKPLVRIGLPSIFGVFAYMIIDVADRQMIERFLGLDALGVYSVGYSFGMVMNMAVGAFASSWSPFFMSFINKQTETRFLFGRVLSYYLIGFGGLTVLFFAVAKPLVLVMTAPNFHDAYLIIGLVSAAYMLKGCYLITLPGIYFAEKLYKQSMLAILAAVLNIILNFFLIPAHGIVGAAVATLATYLCLPVLGWLVSRHHLAVDYEWSRIVRTVTSVLIASSLLHWLSDNFALGLLPTITVNFFVMLSFFGVAYRYLLANTDRVWIWKKLKP